MLLLRVSLVLLWVGLFSNQVLARNYSGPTRKLPPSTSNQELFERYCGKVKAVPNQNEEINIPPVNYQNRDVVRAGKFITDQIAHKSIYYYKGQTRNYDLLQSERNRKGARWFKQDLVEPPASARKSGIGKIGHAFLVQLCADYRDRAEMIEAKIRWVNRTNKLSTKSQPSIDPSKNPWLQLTAESYERYLEFSEQLWDDREAQGREEGHPFRFGKYKVDRPVPGVTVCETKYIFSRYIDQGSRYPGLEEYQNGYSQFKKQAIEKGFCKKSRTRNDLTDVYDFRGDSNFKPFSGESNGMIWEAGVISTQCVYDVPYGVENPTGEGSQRDRVYRSRTFLSRDGKTEKKIISDGICRNYYRKPFLSRWMAARAGLGVWMLRSKKYDRHFSSTQSFIASHREGWKRPFGFLINGRLESSPSDFIDHDWSGRDFGINQYAGLGTPNPDLEFVYERLRDSINLHANWYESAYSDGYENDYRELYRQGYTDLRLKREISSQLERNPSLSYGDARNRALGSLFKWKGNITSEKDQAYSPFIATSYDMSRSDHFVAPGETIEDDDPDGRKHWMLIFRVKGSDWYNSETLEKGKKINFDRMWFDEFSLGTDDLAKEERAWDRLGSALSYELDSILYLHNIEADSFRIRSDRGVGVDKDL